MKTPDQIPDPVVLARAQRAHVGDVFVWGQCSLTVAMLDAVTGDPICDVRHADSAQRVRIAAEDYPVRVAKTLAKGATFTPAP